MSPNTYVVPNAASLMKPRVGNKGLRIRTWTPSGNPGRDRQVGDDSNGKGGSFRIDCQFSHMLYDDPIVFAYQPGMSHLHVFFGNSDVDGMTNTATLEETGTSSTCAGGSANRSAYWIPAMIDVATGFAIKPLSNEVYYKEAGSYGQLADDIDPKWKRSIQVFPVGLRMIAGDAGNQDRQHERLCVPHGQLVAPARLLLLRPAQPGWHSVPILRAPSAPRAVPGRWRDDHPGPVPQLLGRKEPGLSGPSEPHGLRQ